MKLRRIGILAILTAVALNFAVTQEVQSANSQPIGSYYSMKYTNWPPLPDNFFGLEAAEISPGVFILNDLDWDYDAINSLVEFMSSAPEPPGGGGGETGGSPIETEPPDPIPMIPVLLSSCNVGLLPPIYQVTNVILTLTNVEANGVYDLFTTPSLSPPSWRWLTRSTNGQTSFVITNPPASESYYAAACTNALQQWLIGAVGVVTNAPDRVTVWLDQSGNTNHAYVRLNSTEQRPDWVTNVINGLPVVRFYGTNGFQTNLTSSITNWTEAEAFVVLKTVSAVPSGTRGLWIMWTNTSDSSRYPDNPSGEIVDSFGSRSVSPSVLINV